MARSRARQMATRVHPGKPVVHTIRMIPRTRRIRFPNPVNNRISLEFVIRLTCAVFLMLLITCFICASGLAVTDHVNSMPPKPSTSQLQDEMRQEHAGLELFRNDVGRLRTENGLLMVNNVGDMTIQELHQLEKQLNDGLTLVKQKKDVMLLKEIEHSNREVRELNYENEFLRGEIEKLKQFLPIMQHKADICTKSSANESAQEDAKNERKMFQQLVRALSQPEKTHMRGITDRCSRATEPSTSQFQVEMRQEQVELELLRNDVRRLRHENSLPCGDHTKKGEALPRKLIQVAAQVTRCSYDQ